MSTLHRSWRAGVLALVLAACGESGTNPTPNPPPPPPPAPVAQVDVAGASDLLVGQAAQFTAATRGSDGQLLTGRIIVWSTSSNAVATVSAAGMVNGVAPGNATITATSEGKTASMAINVSNVPVAAVSITPAVLTLQHTRDSALVSVVTAANGTVLDRPVSWSSSAPTTVRVQAETGVVTALALGEATITAQVEGKTATTTVTVVPRAVAAVDIAADALTLKLGADTTFTAVARDDRGVPIAGSAMTWASSNPAVATVDAATGLVTAVESGTATISASSAGKSDNVAVTVIAPVATVTIQHALDTVEAWTQPNLVAVLRDAKGRVLTGREVTWTSSDPAIASVQITGPGAQQWTILGRDRGTVTVTATSEGIVATATRVIVIKYYSVAVGTMHACNIASGGIVWCWGLNGDQGRIGSPALGENEFSSRPIQLPGGRKYAKISTYARTSCGITIDGEAFCWGTNAWGQLGAGSIVSGSYIPLRVEGGHLFVDIATGSDHSCAIDAAGKAFCWGHNDWRQLGTGNSTASSVPVAVATSLTFRSIAAGSGAVCGVATSGSTYCWGANSIGQLGDGGKISFGNTFIALPNLVVGGHAFASVDLGNQFTCAVTTGGAGYCWGSNSGKLGIGNGTEYSSPQAVAGGHIFEMISSGANHSCGVTTTGDAYCWGTNTSGQLGNPMANGSSLPIRAVETLKLKEVAAAGIGTGSGAHTCAISRDRLTTYCWGRNDVGQLGNDATTAPAVRNTAASIVFEQRPLPWN